MPSSAPSSRSTAGAVASSPPESTALARSSSASSALRRVEVVVDRGAHALGEGPRVGAVGTLGGGEQAVQERGALVEVGVVPLEPGAVVVAHEREADRARVGRS